jgi:uncharacterized membrane protein
VVVVDSVLPYADIRELLTPARLRSSRLESVDLLRGAVLILMVLDHTRDFFSGLNFAPETLSTTSGPLFFTRFITHFCAPVFFLLAGLGGSLSLSQGKALAEVSRFFCIRGLWLVLLDMTVMSYSWTFVFSFWYGGVLWSLGWSMIAMSLLVYLPVPLIAAFGAGIVVAHNLLDPLNPAVFGRFSGLWVALHGHGLVRIAPGRSAFFVLFSIIPWVGVMAVGYALGTFVHRANWRKPAFVIGLALTIAFLILRVFHLYGNGNSTLQPWAADAAGPWKLQSTLTLTIISFFNTLKYPASLQFLLMTLGPSLMVLAWLPTIHAKRGLARVLVVFGRVPLFFYVLHLYLIHSLAVWIGFAWHQPIVWLLQGGPMLHFAPNGYGHGLVFIYAMWLTVTALLYVPCRWFRNFKHEHQEWSWLRYL